MQAARPVVVGRRVELRLVPRDRSRARLLPEEEGELVSADDDGARGRGYGGGVTWRVLVLAAALLTVTGELEVMLGSGHDDGRLVSALALPALTLPLAYSRRAPLAALLIVALALALQAALGGFLAGSVVTTIAVLVVALYCAGRYAPGARDFAGAAAAAAAVAATRSAFDPAAQSPREALLTLAAVATPLLVGRWARGQGLLQRELADKTARRARDRERDARHAAEEERARIAADLQVAVAEGLRTIVGHTGPLRGELRAGDHVAARQRLAGIAGTARAALGDVRRVLGVLRHDGEAPRLAPPLTDPLASAPPRPEAPAPSLPPRPDAPRRLRPALADRLLAAAVLAVAVTELAVVAPLGAPLTAVAIAAPLLWRRRRPVAVALAVLVAIALQSTLLDLASFPLGDILAMVVATYAIGAYAARRRALAGLGLMAVGAAVHAAVFYPDGVVPALLGGVALPWTIGRVVRGNRDLTREGRQKNLEIERSRAREARAAVTSERMRVARELHDAVAHNISVIAIQAGGADGIVERDPARTEQCVELIETVAREALAELGRLTRPAAAEDDDEPSLARVDRLAERARAAGVPVELSVEGPPARLHAGVDLAAFRIVQEALANAAKHARANRAWVTVRYGQRAIELEIADDGRGSNGSRATPDSGGHGLIGMRERVALYGGSLDAGPQPAGGYRVRARLPIEGA